MGMILSIRKASDEKIKELLKNPKTIIEYLYGPEFVEPELPSGIIDKLKNLVSKKEQEKQTPTKEKWEEPGPDDLIDLDKSWHGLHYFFTGTAWEGKEPENFLLVMGDSIGNIEVGYGPARAITSDKLKIVHEYLATITETTLKERYNPDEIKDLDIYPDIYQDMNDDDWEYIFSYFQTLKNFINNTANDNSGIIIYMD